MRNRTASRSADRVSAPPPRPRRRPLLALGRAVSWHRRKLAVVAALGAVLTGIAAVAPEGPATIEAVQATQQLAGGTVLTAQNLTVKRVRASDAPVGLVSEPTELIGMTVAAPIAARQTLTNLAVVTPQAAVAPGRVLAPLRLIDDDVAALLRPGELVDVLAADAEQKRAKVIASAVRIIAVPHLDQEGSVVNSGTLVLVEVDRATAAELAKASVSSTLTVIWR